VSKEHDHLIDLTGESAPYALVKCRLALEEVAVGQVLRFLVRDEESVRSIKVCLPFDGDEIVAVNHLEDNITEIVARKLRD
jgi:TusA-related sulfurtransferase